jgi:hypothetical protein
MPELHAANHVKRYERQSDKFAAGDEGSVQTIRAGWETRETASASSRPRFSNVLAWNMPRPPRATKAQDLDADVIGIKSLSISRPVGGPSYGGSTPCTSISQACGDC